VDWPEHVGGAAEVLDGQLEEQLFAGQSLPGLLGEYWSMNR
jgi:hypothetical protein